MMVGQRVMLALALVLLWGGMERSCCRRMDRDFVPVSVSGIDMDAIGRLWRNRRTSDRPDAR